jgi:hypothetical protein
MEKQPQNQKLLVCTPGQPEAPGPTQGREEASWLQIPALWTWSSELVCQGLTFLICEMRQEFFIFCFPHKLHNRKYTQQLPRKEWNTISHMHIVGL